MRKNTLASKLIEKDERSGIERRQFAYAACIPERRICSDRRRKVSFYLVTSKNGDVPRKTRWQALNRTAL